MPEQARGEPADILPPDDRPRRDGRALRATLLLVGLLTLFRLWFCTRLDLSGDEAYYWLWSKHLDWCYYSKGPLVAWTIALGTRLLGDTVAGVRFPAVLLGAATALLTYRLARRLFSARIGFWTVVVLCVTPLYVPGAMLMTIDPLSVFFWVAAADAFWSAKDTDRAAPWLATGLLIGLGMLGKYTNVALIPSFALFLALSPSCRRRLAGPGFWIMVTAALLSLLPALAWNANHDWITLKHLRTRGAMDRPWRFSLSEFGQFLGTQLGVWFPPFFAGAAAAFAAPGLRRRAPLAWRYMACLALPLFGFYTVLAFNDAGEPNWTAPAFVSATIAAAAAWHAWSRAHRAARIAAVASIALAALLAAGTILAAALFRLPTKRDPFARVRGHRDLAQHVEALRRGEGADFVIARNYQVAALLAFYLPGRPRTFIPASPTVRNQFSFWPGYDGMPAGATALFVAKEEAVPDSLSEEFDEIRLARDVLTRHRGQPVRHFYVYTCRGFRPPRLPVEP